MMSKKVKPTDTEQELRQAFSVFDRDGSGTISAAELKQVLTSLGEDLTPEQIEEMIQQADTNRDGTIDCELFDVPFLWF